MTAFGRMMKGTRKKCVLCTHQYIWEQKKAKNRLEKALLNADFLRESVLHSLQKRRLQCYQLGI